MVQYFGAEDMRHRFIESHVYFDACNLYGWSMSEYLPIGGFMWGDVSRFDDWTEFTINLKDDQDEGYMFVNCN